MVGYFAIIWLTKVVRSGKIWCFSVYLVVLAAAILVVSHGGAAVISRRPVMARASAFSPHLVDR